MKNDLVQCVLQFFIGWLLLTLAVVAKAEDSFEVAKSKANLWPKPISSREAFDIASRAEILIFLSVYKEKFSAEVKPADIKVKSINSVSFDRWKKRFRHYWLNTFLDAEKTCNNAQDMGCGFKEADFKKLLAYSVKFSTSLPAEYSPWAEMSREFYQAYIKEQARLAALFPNPTSEILPIADTEIFGDGFKDGEFLMTMDDGPTQSDDTEKYSHLLRENKISAFCFALGDSLETKLKKTSVVTLKGIYRGHCLASHGYHHNPHPKWAGWKSSIDSASHVIRRITENNSPVLFRPPYGERQAELVRYLASQHSLIILWNIDSQDWQHSITSDEVSARVKKLMLLWRKGIILFHDVHKKAFTAIPDAIDFSNQANLRWIDCSSI
jgi:peptidoglycan/xylan/chitin deacetylase (PgdA/CDA1 family)